MVSVSQKFLSVSSPLQAGRPLKGFQENHLSQVLWRALKKSNKIFRCKTGYIGLWNTLQSFVDCMYLVGKVSVDLLDWTISSMLIFFNPRKIICDCFTCSEYWHFRIVNTNLENRLANLLKYFIINLLLSILKSQHHFKSQLASMNSESDIYLFI